MALNSNKTIGLKIRLHFYLALILLIHSAFYLVYWLAIGDYKLAIDQFIVAVTGFKMPYTILVMVLTALVGIWSLFRSVRLRSRLRNAEWKSGIFKWVYLSVSLLFLILFYFSFAIITHEDPSQLGVIYHLLNLTRLVMDPLLFLMAAILLRRLILFLRRKASQSEKQWPWRVGIVLVLIMLVGIWLIPTVFLPNWAYRGDLPAKPALLAHRGASMLAPENTLAAAELAADYGAFGFETDVRISLDGIPFLMHDDTLERTTNIAELYPQRVNDNASDFTMDELKTLNAGLWFIQKDPYGTIDSGLVSQTQLSINQGQKIPTLQEALEVVKEENMVIIFDLRYPPQNHPYYDQFFNIVFEQCEQSNLDENIWFLAAIDNVEKLVNEAPQMTRVIGASSSNLPEPDYLLDEGYEIVNVDSGVIKRDIQAYRKEGLGVNVYTIDQAWLFSQIWLSGVTSITTNNIHSLTNLENPALNVPYSGFLLFWGLFGIVLAIWLASAQPAPIADQDQAKTIETPDLMDFGMKENQNSEETPPEYGDNHLNKSSISASKINKRLSIDDDSEQDTKKE